jgi:hypothetical protein
VDIPNGYTSNVVSYQQTRVAHGGGMADSQPGGLIAGGMVDCRLPCHGRFHAAMSWQIPRRQELMADLMLPYHGELLDTGAYGRSGDRPMADYWRLANGGSGSRPMADDLVAHA